MCVDASECRYVCVCVSVGVCTYRCECECGCSYGCGTWVGMIHMTLTSAFWKDPLNVMKPNTSQARHKQSVFFPPLKIMVRVFCDVVAIVLKHLAII